MARRSKARRYEVVLTGRAERSRGLCERHFWILASGVVLISILTQTFDFSLTPPAFKGLFITRPYCGLHDWHFSHLAWDARSHVKYGLDYTQGYRTAAVGDPPPDNPLRYASHPSLDTLIIAFGMLIFGTEEWEVRLFDLILSIPSLLLILFILRKLYGSSIALMSGLLMVILPVFAFFSFGLWMALMGLWALYRYLILIGRLANAPQPKRRYFFELGIALFLMIQLGWDGVFPVFVIGMHYVISCFIHKRIQWRLLAVLAFASLSSFALNLYVMINGYLLNMQAEAAAIGIVERGTGRLKEAWEQIKALYQWRASEGERAFFEWIPWFATIKKYALTNFTIPVLIILIGYLIYLLIAHLAVFVGKITGDPASRSIRIPRSFTHVWFFLLPGPLYMFVFKGAVWAHQYWQSLLLGFVAIGTTLGLSLIADSLGKIKPSLGKVSSAVTLTVVVLFCNKGLVAYRAIRWQSPVTIEMFKKLNRRIPPDKALLTFKDFTVRQSKAKAPFYRPEYAWYLDREMIVANEWAGFARARSVRIDQVVRKTIREIQRQAGTGNFPCYFVPACEKPTSASVSSDPGGYCREIANLNITELDQRLKDHEQGDDVILYQEKRKRYREALIKELKKLYDYEYYKNTATPGSDEFCQAGNTPCYIFDLTSPKS